MMPCGDLVETVLLDQFMKITVSLYSRRLLYRPLPFVSILSCIEMLNMTGKAKFFSLSANMLFIEQTTLPPELEIAMCNADPAMQNRPDRTKKMKQSHGVRPP